MLRVHIFLTSTDVVFDGPWFVTVINGQDGFCGGCSTSVQRVVDYQVMTYSGGYSSTIWVCENPSVYNWSCKQPYTGAQTTSCPSAASAAGGAFADQWTLGSDKWTPVPCGFDITDPWVWAPTKQIMSTLMTLTGYVDNNQIGINGTVWPPGPTDPLIGYTICPSGTTFKSQDINVNPCN